MNTMREIQTEVLEYLEQKHSFRFNLILSIVGICGHIMEAFAFYYVQNRQGTNPDTTKLFDRLVVLSNRGMIFALGLSEQHKGCISEEIAKSYMQFYSHPPHVSVGHIIQACGSVLICHMPLDKPTLTSNMACEIASISFNQFAMIAKYAGAKPFPAFKTYWSNVKSGKQPI